MTTSHHQNGYHFISQRLWEYDPLFHATEKYWLEYQITPKAYCNICYDYYPMKTMWQDCPSNSNEHYCSNCLKQYLSSKISVGQVYADNSVACPCSTSACAGRIKENIILYLLENDSSLIEKFHIFSLNAEVASSTNKTFCPNSQCGAVVTITSSWSKQVSCSKCQIKFCFNCRESHNPWITCSMVSSI